MCDHLQAIEFFVVAIYVRLVWDFEISTALRRTRQVFATAFDFLIGAVEQLGRLGETNSRFGNDDQWHRTSMSIGKLANSRSYIPTACSHPGGAP